MQNFWWVYQGDSYQRSLEEAFIMAPLSDSIHHWINVSRVKRGDIIFNYFKSKMEAVSIAQSDAYVDRYVNRENLNEKHKDGWKVDIETYVLKKKIPINKIGNKISLLNEKYSPVNRNGGPNQGYLYNLTPRVLSIITSELDLEELPNQLKETLTKSEIIEKEVKSMNDFNSALTDVHLNFLETHIQRFIAALISKPFVILTGLSGSGKTKLAQAFAYWITENEKQYSIIPVGADWTNREPILGFVNALEYGKYIKPENNIVDLIIEAGKEENSDKPFFLILDEMNLSHVERYFADILSVMESGEKINLHPDVDWNDDVPAELVLPLNLFIIGTVNIDETTYMFSPKVLDRAHVIEFRVSDDEMENFLKEPFKPDLELLRGLGKNMAADFILKSQTEISDFDDFSSIESILLDFFKELKKIGAEFGYRTASEIYRFSGILKILTKENGNEWGLDDIVDAAVIQKLLPKVHGSRSKLEPVLKTLAELCLSNKDDFDAIVKSEGIDYKDRTKIKYPLSLEKILRMRTRVIQDGFTSFTEA